MNKTLASQVTKESSSRHTLSSSWYRVLPTWDSPPLPLSFFHLSAVAFYYNCRSCKCSNSFTNAPLKMLSMKSFSFPLQLGPGSASDFVTELGEDSGGGGATFDTSFDSSVPPSSSSSSLGLGDLLRSASTSTEAAATDLFADLMLDTLDCQVGKK